MRVWGGVGWGGLYGSPVGCVVGYQLFPRRGNGGDVWRGDVKRASETFGRHIAALLHSCPSLAPQQAAARAARHLLISARGRPPAASVARTSSDAERRRGRCAAAPAPPALGWEGGVMCTLSAKRAA